MQDLYAETRPQVDRLFLPRILKYTHGNRQESARLLGIARETLRYKLRDLRLFVTRSFEAPENSSSRNV